MKTQAAHIQPVPAHRRLAESVRITVGSFLGTGFSSGLSHSNLGPTTAGVCAAGFYALIPILQTVVVPTSRELILLSWWGAIYFGIVVALTRSTALAVIDILDALLLPNIS